LGENPEGQIDGAWEQNPVVMIQLGEKILMYRFSMSEKILRDRFSMGRKS